jgi:hypothetical protein
MSSRLVFKTRTCEIVIDYDKCIAPKCRFACVKADRLYGRGVLKIAGGKPVLAVSQDEAARICNECLACEIHCEWNGGKAVRVIVPI